MVGRGDRRGPAAWMPAVLAVTVILGGCHDVAEYGDFDTTGLIVIDTGDLSVAAELAGFEGGRVICSLGTGQPALLVACNTGMLLRVDTDDWTVEATTTVGPPFSQGYGSMVLDKQTGEKYLIGGYGSILRLGTGGGILGDFVAGPSPCALATTGVSRLFVCDQQDARIREVSTISWEVLREHELSSPACAITPYAENTLQFYHVAVSQVEAEAWMIIGGEILGSLLLEIPPSSDVASLPDTAVFCATHPMLTSADGAVTIGRHHTAMEIQLQSVSLEGHPRRVCPSPLTRSFWVAASLDGGGSRIYEIDGYDCSVIRSTDVSGQVWDIMLLEDQGHLILLTSD